MQTKMKLNGRGWGWGGLRMHAGRKRRNSRGSSHEIRERVSLKSPLHIDFRYRTRVRNKETLKLLKRAISNARKHGMSILHYSFQANHIHLIVEASSNAILTKGMRSLTITISKGLKLGRTQTERYHLHVLRTLRETRNAIQYVLFNEQKHESGTYGKISDYSSVVYLQNALSLIKEFAKMKRTTLTLEKAEMWNPDSPSSYFAQRAFT